MHLIVYVSECEIPAAGLQGALESIAESSCSHNDAAGITGVLLCEYHHFLQVLEGEETALRALMQRIERDPRHRDIVVLVDREIEGRAFPDWSLEPFFIDNPGLLNASTLQHLRDVYLEHCDLNAGDLVSFLKRIVDEIDDFMILRKSDRTKNLPP
ncbi:Sensors of blue-light using FAD [Methyloligella halotolerans]|uniref:Sensors of blue-light using FAD n=1 Tax=Methyloligella halotolerans TaxID=1177755 RepID=A0A1E2RYF5_9HYPH|nr:BLUF domain-containing protein [Methyloligella halotolerans]ODA67138.1 Sensors of blue-light using FAD [Methyloligella halotolerans]